MNDRQLYVSRQLKGHVFQRKSSVSHNQYGKIISQIHYFLKYCVRHAVCGMRTKFISIMHSCLIRTNVSRFAHCFRGHSIKCLVCRTAIASEGRGQVWYPDAISSWINGRNCKAQITTSIVWTMRTWLRVKRCVYLDKLYLLPRWWHVRYM